MSGKIEISVYWSGLTKEMLGQGEQELLSGAFGGCQVRHFRLEAAPQQLPKGTAGRIYYLCILVAPPEALGTHKFSPVAHGAWAQHGRLAPQAETIALLLAPEVALAETRPNQNRRREAIRQTAIWLQILKAGRKKGPDGKWGYPQPNGVSVTKWPWGN